MTTNPPGWYDDPDNSSAQRYWDGQNWTPHRQRKPASRPAQPAAPRQAPATPPAPPPATWNGPSSPPPAQSQPPHGTPVRTGATNMWLVLAGLALVLVIAALVAGRVGLGSFLPGILLVAAIAIIGAILVLRSHQPAARKAMVVTAIVVVVAVAVPASSKVVFPVYNHFFGQKSAQASSGSPADGGAPQGSGGAPQGSGGTPSPSSGGPKSGILVSRGGPGRGNQIYGFIDPNSGKYSEVASFVLGNGGPGIGEVAVSPDFTKLAVTNQGNAGWIDTSGKFTSVTPKVDPGAFGGSPPSFTSIGFDAAGNYYYIKGTSSGSEVYKLAAGSTTNAQMVSSGLLNYLGGSLAYDGSMQVGCSGVHWLGPDNSVSAGGTQIQTVKVTGHDSKGCPTVDSYSAGTSLLPKTNNVDVRQAVGNHDGTKVAFIYLGRNASGTQMASETSLYIIAADGSGQPTKVNLTNLSGDELSQMSFLRWQ